MLEQELEIYHKIKGDLITKYPNGGYIVIKGDENLGVWSSRNDALKIGLEKFGNVPFLVKNILDSEVLINFSKNILFAV